MDQPDSLPEDGPTEEGDHSQGLQGCLAFTASAEGRDQIGLAGVGTLRLHSPRNQSSIYDLQTLSQQTQTFTEIFALKQERKIQKQ